MKKIVIVRGPSGSGKSTYSKKNFPDADIYHRHSGMTCTVQSKKVIVSADEFFMKPIGKFCDPDVTVSTSLQEIRGEYVFEYKFNPTKIGEAHAECFKNFLFAVEAEKEVIIVDNTNIHQWEYTNYAVVAKMHGYDVEIVEFRPITVDDVRLCIKRNQHRVPADIVSRMCVEFEDCPFATVFPIEDNK